MKSVFGRALDLSAGERTGWVRRQALKSSVIREVFSLLRADGDGYVAQPSQNQAVGNHKETPPRFEPGLAVAGRFRILEFLGRGGMGEVYAVEDAESGERVALKVVIAGSANESDYLLQLRRELRLARTIKSEFVCRMNDVHRLPIQDGDLLCVSMELLEGKSLQHHLDSGPLSEESTVHIAKQIAAGLEAIHAAGIVHRDLKSANVILAGAEQRAVIVDFGLARQHGGTPGLESIFATGVIVGTPAFMAPEQLHGRTVSKSADIYAFGVILYQCVTGRLPFEGATPLAVALRKSEGRLRPISEAAPSVSPSLKAAIEACLDREPANRPSSATEVIEIARGRALTAARKRFLSRRKIAVAAAAITAPGAAWLAWRMIPHREPEQARIHARRAQELSRRRTAYGIRAALTEYRQALAIDERYAEAWAGLADAYAAAAHYVLINPVEARQQAAFAADKALALDSRQAKAYGALAYVRGTDLKRWREADALFRRAVESFPDEALLHAWYAAYLGRARRHDEAIEQAKACVRLDPGSFYMNHQLAVEYFRAGKSAEYLAQSDDLVKLHPLEAQAHLNRARALEQHGRLNEAEQEIRHGEVYGAGDAARSFIATLRVAQGRRTEAETILTELREAWMKKPVETNLLVTVYGALGMAAEAAEAIRTGAARGDATVLATAANPYVRNIAGDQRMQAAFRELGLL